MVCGRLAHIGDGMRRPKPSTNCRSSTLAETRLLRHPSQSPYFRPLAGQSASPQPLVLRILTPDYRDRLVRCPLALESRLMTWMGPSKLRTASAHLPSPSPMDPMKAASPRSSACDEICVARFAAR